MIALIFRSLYTVSEVNSFEDKCRSHGQYFRSQPEFSRVARLADEKGMVVITKNNMPRYLLIELSQAEAVQSASNDDVLIVSSRLIAKNRQAYEELAK